MDSNHPAHGICPCKIPPNVDARLATSAPHPQHIRPTHGHNILSFIRHTQILMPSLVNVMSNKASAITASHSNNTMLGNAPAPPLNTPFTTALPPGRCHKHYASVQYSLVNEYTDGHAIEETGISGVRTLPPRNCCKFGSHNTFDVLDNQEKVTAGQSPASPAFPNHQSNVRSKFAAVSWGEGAYA